MDTKLKADIAESAVTTELLKRGYRVLRPVGDRLPYDLGVDVGDRLIRIQVKNAWFNAAAGCYMVDTRRTKTNRYRMLRSSYSPQDFDFAVVYLDDLDVFYVFPVNVFIRYGSTVTIVETDKRQRKPKSSEYRDRWELVSEWAHRGETLDGILSNSVKPEKVIPSQARFRSLNREGVETRWQAPETAVTEG